MDHAKIKILSPGKTDYDTALAMQTRERDMVMEGACPGSVFFLEHDPPVVTLGKRAGEGSIRVPLMELQRRGFQVREIDRGGDVTVHEPGQLVIYIVVPVKAKKSGPFVEALSLWFSSAINEAFSLQTFFDNQRPGIWSGGRKLGSVGFDLRGGVSMHGLAINVCNNLSGFELIVPCGQENTVMTTLSAETAGHISVEQCAALFAEKLKSNPPAPFL